MRYWPAAIRVTGIAGLLLGAASGILHWSGFWPALSGLALSRACALGWLAGLLASFPLAWWLSRRPPESGAPSPGLAHRAARGLLLVVALAPLALWATVVFPRAPLRAALGGRGRDTRPNLILISIDALRADYLGAYGNRRGLSPNLDAFARQATQYDSAYASSPWTLTSLGSLFTSVLPSQAGLKPPYRENNGWYGEYAALPTDRVILSERLQRAGYTTAAELTNLFLREERGWTRGFDWYRNETLEEDRAHTLDRAARVTQAATAWLRLNRGQPFFLWVHYFDPHAPYDAPTTPEALRKKHKHWWTAGSRTFWDARVEHGSAAIRAEYASLCRDMYGEEVRYCDHYVGDLLQAIRSAGLWDDSLIVITADHGEELLDHGGYEHGHSMHREVESVPLLVKWPRGVTADRRIAQTVGLADVGATFLASAGLTLDTGSIPPLPRKSDAHGQEVYAEGLLYGSEQTALTTDEWRVIYHPYQTLPAGHFEVYDRRTDPWERANLAPTGAAAGLCAHLQQLSNAAEVLAKHRFRPESIRTAKSVVSEKTRQQLRSLGYMK